jgi:hypothetical protein
VDEEGIFNTIKESIPELLETCRKMKTDLDAGRFDSLF